MAWTTPGSWPVGFFPTSTFLNQNIRDNFLELRGGGIAISGQAANRIPFASSATQLATSANLTFDGTLLVVSGHGLHQFSGNGAGMNSIRVINATNGVAAGTQLELVTDMAGEDLLLQSFASSFTSAGTSIAAGSRIASTGSGGLNIAAVGPIRIYSNATETARFHASRGVSIGDTTDPGATNLRIAGTLRVAGFGSHLFSAGGAGFNAIQISNPTAGVGNGAQIELVTDGSGEDFLIQSNSSTFTTSGTSVQNGTRILSSGVGGLNIVATGGPIRVYSGGSTETVRFHASRGVSIGDTTDPGATNFRVAGSSTFVGAITVAATTLKAHASGGVSIGDATDPGATNFRVAGTSTLVGAVTFSAAVALPLTLGATALKAHASTGVSIGDATDPGATNFRVAGTSTLVGAITVSAASALQFSVTIGNNGGGADTVIAGGTGAGSGVVTINSRPCGTGNQNGCQLYVGRNTSGSGAAGFLLLVGAGGAQNMIWADASAAPGMLRISTAAPQEDGTPADTSGTVVGTQTSTLDTKDVLGDGIAPVSALAIILRTPVKNFRYKGGSYNGTTFHGIVSDYSPEFAMDPDAAHPNGRSFNPVSAFGYTVQAFKALEARIVTLERILDM